MAECPGCIKDRVEAGEKPEQLVVLPTRTLAKKIPVTACPTCDLGVIRIALSHKS